MIRVPVRNIKSSIMKCRVKCQLVGNLKQKESYLGSLDHARTNNMIFIVRERKSV